MLPTARAMPMVISAIPVCSIAKELDATPAAKIPAPGTNVKKLACPTRAIGVALRARLARAGRARRRSSW